MRTIFVCLFLTCLPVFAQPYLDGPPPLPPIGPGGFIDNFDRQQLPNGVAAYSIDLRVGPGEHDIIGFHRVVREHNGIPSPQGSPLFLVHGDLFDFRTIFLAGFEIPQQSEDLSYAYYLAQAGVDVWGIDRRWSKVPADLTDYSFLDDWDLSLEIEDVQKAMAFASSMRLLTMGVYDQFLLQGWSSGGIITWGLANAEAPLPSFFRQVKGIIPTDIFYSLPENQGDENSNDACARYNQLASQIASGDTYYNNSLFLNFPQLYNLDPEGASPIMPGFTNRQALIAAGGLTFLTLGEYPYTPIYHFLGTNFDTNGVPTGFNFSDVGAFAGAMERISLIQSKGTGRDMEKVVCKAETSIHETNLDIMDIPVFYVGAVGGFGHLGTLTLDKLQQASDVSSLVIQTLPDEAALMDYGHMDLFFAQDAPERVWLPILDWIQAH